MVDNRGLRRVLLIAGALITSLPVVFIAGSFFVQSSRVLDSARRVTVELNQNNLENAVRGVYSLARLYQTESDGYVAATLDLARHVAREFGAIREVEERISWNAENQFTHEVTSVRLPAMFAGDTWLDQVVDRNFPVPIVDDVSRIAGVTCTIFQRMNEAGDMLRVATTVTRKNGTRAAGTFIPRTNPDRTSNPVTEALVGGSDFVGRAWVVDQWYITAYTPLLDDEERVFGALYVGFPQSQLDALGSVIAQIELGETGYVYVLDGKGNYVFHPALGGGVLQPSEAMPWSGDVAAEISSLDEGQKRDLSKLLHVARALAPEEVASVQYDWPLPETDEACRKEARLMYFAPWDWVIGAAACERDVEQAAEEIVATSDKSQRLLLLISSIVLLATLVVFWVVASRIFRQLTRTHEQLTDTVSRLEGGSRSLRALAAFSEYLQACGSEGELFDVASRSLGRVLPGTSGALATFPEDEREVAQVVVQWGDEPPAQDEVLASECWALRRGAAHLVFPDDRAPRCRCMPEKGPAPTICVPLNAQGTVLGMISVICGEESEGLSEERLQELLEERQILVNNVVERLAPAIVALRLRERLRLESVQDPLTGLYNRRHMESSLRRELSHAERHRQTVGVMMMDIDRFKRINDQHGHGAGDAVLAALGELLREHVREEDIVCRYGGEEFALILGGISVLKLSERAEQLCEAVRDLRIDHAGLTLTVTVSIGLALFPSHAESGDELLRAADRALYQAKSAGRDRVVVFRLA